jgi:hypothetical protein
MKVGSSLFLLISLSLGLSLPLAAQDNYEIQVYASDLVEKRNTMVELHSNYTLNGTTEVQDGLYPSNHAIHETLEITHGFSGWFEVGSYLFTSIGSDNRTALTGVHIRPRFAVPEDYHLPFGLSLSMETGYQDPAFFGCEWSSEIRPIIDKRINKLFLAVNLTLDNCLDKGKDHRFEFSPSIKTSYDISKKVSLGLEYYAGLGPIRDLDPVQQQKHQLFGAVDWDFNPRWEFNAGLGYGLTTGTDKWIVKLILGYRIPF